MRVQMRAASTVEFHLQLIQSHLDYLDSVAPGAERDAVFFLDSMKGLNPFLRALLVTDGTVTLSLRAYFDEDIRVAAIHQSWWSVESTIPHLSLTAGSEAFYRKVELIGSETGRSYVEATSILNPAALKPELFTALIEEDVSMGEVLRNAARGSYREILDVRRLDEARMARTYTVVLDSKPAILITEVFNTRWF